MKETERWHGGLELLPTKSSLLPGAVHPHYGSGGDSSFSLIFNLLLLHYILFFTAILSAQGRTHCIALRNLRLHSALFDNRPEHLHLRPTFLRATCEGIDWETIYAMLKNAYRHP